MIFQRNFINCDFKLWSLDNGERILGSGISCADVQVAPHRQDVPGLQVRAVHRRSLVPERARRAGTLALATIR